MKSRFLASGILLISFNLMIVSTVRAEVPAPQADLISIQRLFFTEAQRNSAYQPEVDRSVDKEGTKRTTSMSAFEQGPGSANKRTNKAVFRYTGLVQSTRGIQLILNGVLWRPGLHGVVRARVQQGSDRLEIELQNGKRYRLILGETLELDT